ncbi:GNAT family N-acetyltransferase [Neptuniibacter marinus]|uniref:GNAT family N-acetyltransferase n=1 Tax=Neptuniibacter marinus TaxID=1806670 RepID=UPI00082C846F|nr:GNAT family N-acetyltransferase [Neptuniibacter marinus]
MNSLSSDIKVLSVKADEWAIVYPMWEHLICELPSYHFNPFGKPLLDEQRVHLKNTLQGCLAKDEAEVCVAVNENNEICGTIAVIQNTQRGYDQPKSGVLFNLWVNPLMRRHQIGTTLVKYAKEWLLVQGATSMQVGWHLDNSIAASFWLKQGFRQYECIAATFLN